MKAAFSPLPNHATAGPAGRGGRAPAGRGVPRFLLRHRFFLASAALVVLMALHSLNGQWEGDFWEHSAAVGELAVRPWSPRHPHFLLDAPHAFASPYALALAWASRLTGASPVSVLAAAGLVNLVFWLVFLRQFVRLLSPHAGAPFYALLFTLFLWGREPWHYSGFFHLGVLGFVLPYPSTFAMWVALAVLLMYAGGKGRDWRWLIPLAVLVSLVLLAHPLTFLFLAVGLVSLAVAQRRRPAEWLALAGAVLAAGALPLAWPYFPLARLVRSGGAVYHQRNVLMYVGILGRTWPALLGLPVVVERLRADRRDPLALMLGGTAAVYVWGAVSAGWSYGRAISCVVWLLAVAAAEGAARVEGRLRWRGRESPALRLACAGLLFAVLALASRRTVETFLAGCWPRQLPTYDRYAFLSSSVRQDDVVLADIDTSEIVPTFGAKVVAVDRPLAFVADTGARLRDLERFFSPQATRQDRFDLIRKYGVRLVLLYKARVANWRAVKEDLTPPGQVRFSDRRFVLIAMPSADPAPNS